MQMFLFLIQVFFVSSVRTKIHWVCFTFKKIRMTSCPENKNYMNTDNTVKIHYQQIKIDLSVNQHNIKVIKFIPYFICALYDKTLKLYLIKWFANAPGFGGIRRCCTFFKFRYINTRCQESPSSFNSSLNKKGFCDIY